MYSRILLKLSGEVLSGEGSKGFSEEKVQHLVSEISSVIEKNIKIGLVIGAGNLFRGREFENLSRQIADEIGMLGTVINSLYLKETFEKNGLKTVIMSQIVNLPAIKPVNYDDIEEYFSKDFLIIFAGGTSNPLFTTDTAAALRAVEMGAQLIVKATKVDGVYDKDPKKFSDAVKFQKLSFDEAIEKGLRILDTEAFSICKRYRIPIKVINFFEKGILLRALIDDKIGSIVEP
ncbi:MAG: uridylate kinase [Thermotogaceae bacterium]|nr:uridylate kinase [Thermotogaceae bacterium]